MTAKEELTSISQLLHLAHHRNKNQHRLSKWYKSFSQLRRQVSKLLAEIESLETAERFDVTGTGKGKAGKGKGKLDGKESKYVKAAREKVEARVEFLEERVVEKCYLALSNLVADNQYAALGLVLMGALASVKRAIRPLGREKVNIEGSSDGPNEQKILQDSEVVTDLGEVVKREEIEKFVETNSGARRDEEGGEGRLEVKKAKKKRKIEGRKEQKISEEASKEVNTAKRPKKKRKKGDAFDDLFSSLV